MLPTSLPSKFAAVDTESNGLSVWRGHRMFAASAAFPNGATKFWRGDFGGLRELLMDDTVDKVFHNAKHDLRMLEYSGFQVRGRVWDTMIFGHLLNGRMAGKGLALGQMAVRYLPSDKRKVVDEIDKWFDDNGYGKDERYEKFIDLPHNILEKRNVGDACLTRDLFMRMYTTVATTFPFLLEQEHKLIGVVKRMEERGIQIDYDAIEQQSEVFEDIIEDCQRHFEGVIGHDSFNINAKKDQMELLEKAGILHLITKFSKKTKLPTLDDYNLRQLHHPVSHMLLLGKAAMKMRNTFLAQMNDASVNGVLHASFNQLGTTTGRFSCSNPNLQNIPIEGDRRTSYTEDEANEAFEMTGTTYAPHLKRIFTCRKGFAHVHSDKKQAEMYMLGHYANDPTMVALFGRGTNIHEEICRELYGELTKGLKTRTKAVVFGYQYGAGLETLARKIGGSIADAIAAKNRLARVLPGLPLWKRNLEKEIRSRHYVQTIHGRRHYLTNSENYIAVNRMCQGTVGDEIKSRMIAIDDYGQSECPGVQILLNVHDDLGSEVPIEHVPKAVPDIKRIMEETSLPYKLALPSSIDITYTRWADLKEIEDVNNVPGPPDRWN